MLQIPLTNEPAQRFFVTLSGNTYEFRIIYNSRTEQWTADIYLGGTLLAAGVSLVGGGDLLSQYNLDIERLYVVNVENPSLDPSFENFGTGSVMVLLTQEEIGELEVG